MTQRMVEYGVIPAEQDAAFVAGLEEVLETYTKPYDPNQRLVCMDEQPIQLRLETKVPIAATKAHGPRVDYAYERTGTARIFMFAEPVAGFRQATARAQRTKSEWALEVAQLLDTRSGACDKITRLMDNRNTPTKGAFYEAFAPDVVRAYIKRSDFVYTPKQGSWLNIAEGELSCLSSQCLADRRIGHLADLQREIGAWSQRTNEKYRTVDWQFNIDDARRTLKRL